MNDSTAYVIGVDYGSDSVRTIIVDASNGQEMASSVFFYPRWKQQLFCNINENQFRQHPLDYTEGLEFTVKDCIEKAGPLVASNIKGLSVDTTGSTPVAVDRTGTPLAMLPGFENNPNAMFVLWKDHTGIREAAEINAHAQKNEPDYLQFAGGIYSSEWFWAKLLHVLRSDEAVRENIYSFVEHCDWIPYLLTGGSDVHTMKRSVCAAGHKALWATQWGGLPPNDFFKGLDPLLDGFTGRLYSETYAANQKAGIISKAWADRLGLPANTVIGIGAYDAHMGAVGGQIEPYYLSKVMGTSTCDMMVVPDEHIEGKLIKGICGQVPGSIIPGMTGLEAGQSAFGDAYAWVRNLLAWPLKEILAKSTLVSPSVLEQLISETEENIIAGLSSKAAQLTIDENSELAVDWFNGRRTPDTDQQVLAALTGLSLGSDAVRVFRAVAESTCFGARAIVERFRQEGIPVKGLIGLGGVAKKSPFIMQMMADVLNMPIRIHNSEQTCALGAAMFAATAAGIFENVEAAMVAMGQGFGDVFYPNDDRVMIYEKRFQKYAATGAFIQSQTQSMS